MANVNWKGGAGGNGDWNTPGDWSGNKVPGASDSVTFGLNELYTVTGGGTVANVDVTAGNVTFDGSIATQALVGASGSYVTIDPNSSFLVSLLVDFSPTSTLEVQGSLSDLGAVVDVALVDGGTAFWQTSAQVNANQLQVFDGGTFSGNILLNDNGLLKLDTTAKIGGTLTLAGNGSIDLSAVQGAASLGVGESVAFQKAGAVLYAAADPGTTLNIAGAIGVAGKADGLINVQGGTVELSGSSNLYSGGSVVDNGATLQLDHAGSAGTGAVFLAGGALVTEQAQNRLVVVGASGNDTISGGGGGLVVFASNAASLQFTGGAAGSVIYGGSGALNLIGGSGGDTIYAWNASSVDFTGGSKGSVVYGGSGLLNATAGSGGDTIFAGNNSGDVLRTGSGPATLVGGGAGAMLIANNSAANVLIAGGGNTTLNGGSATGNNLFFGASGGNTTVEGGLGNDTFVGNGGADTVYGNIGTENVFAGSGYLQLDFVTTFGGGTTGVNGFNVASDRLQLTGFAPDAVQQALQSEQIIGGSTVITLSDNSKIVFWQTTGITASNFIT